MHAYDPHALEIKYVQDDKNTCVLRSLASTLFYTNEHVAKNYFVSQLSSSLSCDTFGFMNKINFSSDILTYCVINKGEQRCCYKLFQWKNKGSFDMFNDFIGHVTLVQLEDSPGNIYHSVSIAGSWIYYSNYKRSLPLMR